MTIVVAVDARHAACIIDDIGIESIDRVLSSRSLRRRRAHHTTTTAQKDDRTLGDPLCLLTSIHIHGGTYHQLHRGYDVLNILVYVCACEKRRRGTGREDDRTGPDWMIRMMTRVIIIVVFMCKQCGCGGTVV